MSKFNPERYHSIIDDVTEQIYAKYPGLLEQYGERGISKCKEDNVHHFHYLETAHLLQNATIFTDYALWLTNVLVTRGMHIEHIIENFNFIQNALPGNLDQQMSENFMSYLSSAISILDEKVTN